MWRAIVATALFCIMLVALLYGMAEAKDTDKKAVILIPKDDKPTIIMKGEGGTTTILRDNKVTFCTTSDGSVIVCTDLN